MDAINILQNLYVFIFGACIGSFLNVCIYRLPIGVSIVSPPSACTKCGRKIRATENIPLVSYIMLSGKCKGCGEKISVQYPIVEGLNAVLYMLLWNKFGFTAEFFIYCIFVSSLVTITFIDLKHYIIPDVISLPGIAAGFTSSFVLTQPNYIDSLIGIVMGGGAFWMISYAYLKFTGKEGMGGGDIKLIAMLGAFLGWQSIPFIIIISSMTGAIVGIFFMLKEKHGTKTAVPFGPFLSFSAIVMIFYGQKIISWYVT